MKANVRFSKNAKLNTVLTSIYEDLVYMCESKETSIQEIKRYKKEFPKELDFNLYQYGNLLVYNDQIRELYKDYKSLKNASIEKLINIYKRQVRFIANYILENE